MYLKQYFLTERRLIVIGIAAEVYLLPVLNSLCSHLTSSTIIYYVQIPNLDCLPDLESNSPCIQQNPVKVKSEVYEDLRNRTRDKIQYRFFRDPTHQRK